MSLELRNKKLIRYIFILTTSPLLVILVFFWAKGSIWAMWDYKILDLVYRQAIKNGYGPEMSHQIVYLPITDNTYKYFGKNILDRTDIAILNDALSELNIRALAYDIIFARPSDPESDKIFESSIKRLSSVYLPIGLAYSDNRKSFKWESGKAYDRFKSDYLHTPVEEGLPNPYYGISALMQTDDLSMAAFNSGHISAMSDTDGVYRHMIMLLKVDDAYIPSLSLSMFLDYAGVPFEKAIVRWGKEIVIPAVKGSFIDNDIAIPIDDRGRAFIPFTQTWEKDFPKMEAHKLLVNIKDEDLLGNIREFFEGKFVFIGDISVGTADLGQTPLESDVPLMITDTSMLNALLTNTFFKKTSFINGIVLIIILGVILGISALSKSSWVLYSTGVLILGGIIGLTWYQFILFNLFPIATLSGGFLFIFFTLVIGIEIAVSKERNFIKNTFSRYVPQKVVNHLLKNPELLKLGGERRFVTVLFADLSGYTSLSEKLDPENVTMVLNDLFNGLISIIIKYEGLIIDFFGDGILCIFGAPFVHENDPERAVRTALEMMPYVERFNRISPQKLPTPLGLHIGIHSGLVIVGNVGSDLRMKYSAVGDTVNLCSRIADNAAKGEIYISENTYKLLPNQLNTELPQSIQVKGKSEPVIVYKLLSTKDETFGESVKRKKSFDVGGVPAERH